MKEIRELQTNFFNILSKKSKSSNFNSRATRTNKIFAIWAWKSCKIIKQPKALSNNFILSDFSRLILLACHQRTWNVLRLLTLFSFQVNYQHIQICEGKVFMFYGCTTSRNSKTLKHSQDQEHSNRQDTPSSWLAQLRTDIVDTTITRGVEVELKRQKQLERPTRISFKSDYRTANRRQQAKVSSFYFHFIVQFSSPRFSLFSALCCCCVLTLLGTIKIRFISYRPRITNLLRDFQFLLRCQLAIKKIPSPFVLGCHLAKGFHLSLFHFCKCLRCEEDSQCRLIRNFPEHCYATFPSKTWKKILLHRLATSRHSHHCRR